MPACSHSTGRATGGGADDAPDAGLFGELPGTAALFVSTLRAVSFPSYALVIALGSRGLCAQQLAPHELLARVDQPAPPGGLVLLDLGDNIDGARLVGPLRRAGWRVLVITGTKDQPHIAAAVAAGAVGWVPKTAPFDDLVAHAVRAAQGRSLVTDTARMRMVDVANAAREAAEEHERRW